MDTAFLSQSVDLSLQQAQAAQRQQMRLQQIEESAVDFEAMFISEMMKPMFEGIETDSMFGGGKGEEVFRGFLLQEYGKQMASSQSLGIADQVKGAMIEMQAIANGADPLMPTAKNGTETAYTNLTTQTDKE